MEPFGIKATFLATAVAVLLAWRARRRNSLTPAGAVAAFCVGFLNVWTGLRGFNLLVFYQMGTSATKYKKDLKATMDGTLATSDSSSAARGPSQVLACSLLATILSLIHAVVCGAERPIAFLANDDNLGSSLTCAILAHHATCLADTLASELGILSKSTPVLITKPWEHVPSGTNGGVTLLGLFWSVFGGFFIGISTLFWDYLSGQPNLNATATIIYCSLCGLVGSLIDSLLGATVQQTYFDADKKLVYQSEDEKPSSAKVVAGLNLLSNVQVNLVSVVLTAGIGGWLIGPTIFAS